MNTSRFLLGAVVLCAFPLPSFAQPETKLANSLPFPLVPIEEAIRLLQPQKPIALHLHDVTLREALIELGQQFNTRLAPPSGSNVTQALATKLSVDIETTSFTETFHAIIKAAGVNALLTQMLPREVSISFGSTRGENDTYVSGMAPFRICIQNISSSLRKTIVLGKPPSRSQSSEFRVNLKEEIAPEFTQVSPRRVRITRAEDEQGRTLQVIEEPARLMGLPDLAIGTATNIQLRPPQEGSRKLSRFEGVIVYIFPTKYEKWEVDDVLNAPNATHEFRSEGKVVRVTISETQKSKTGLTLKLDINSALGGGLQNEGFLAPLSVSRLVSEISLKDANGQVLGRRGMNSRGAQIEIEFELPKPSSNPLSPQFANNPINEQGVKPEQKELIGPISLSVNAPITMAQTEVPFSFSDVPLP